MRIYDVPLADLERIADNLRSPRTGIAFNGDDVSNSAGFRVRGNLRPKAGYVNPYQRTSASYFDQERKVWAICWHGHRDFMRAVMEEYPKARIHTMWADYHGLEDFKDTHEETAFRPLGPPIMGGYPYAYQACSCSESGTV